MPLSSASRRMRNACSYFDNVSGLRLKIDATWLAEGLIQRFEDFRSTVLAWKYFVPGERKLEFAVNSEGESELAVWEWTEQVWIVEQLPCLEPA